MKKLIVLLLLAAAVWYGWNRRETLLSLLDRAREEKAIATAEKSAEKAKAMVNEGRAVDAAVAGQSVTEGMKPADVRSLLGEPTSVDRDRTGGREVWHYDLVGKRIYFRGGRVWSVESD